MVDERIQDAEIVREKYHGEGMTTDELTEEFDCSRGTVINYLDRHDIERRPQGNPRQQDIEYDRLKDAEWMLEHYWGEYWRIKDIADEIGCSRWLVRKWLGKHDIEVRPRGSYKGERHHNFKGYPDEGDYKGEYWRKTREAALERADYECERCGMDNDAHKDEYGQGLDGHHIRPRHEFVGEDGEYDKEAANDLSNIIMLCRECHLEVEGLPIDNGER